jgi:hypothetical protein
MSYLYPFTENILSKYRTNNLLKIKCDWKRFKNLCLTNDNNEVIEEKDEKTRIKHNLITENNFILFLKDSINLYKDTIVFIEKPKNKFLELFYLCLNAYVNFGKFAGDQGMINKIRNFNFGSESKTIENDLNRYFGLRLLGKLKCVQIIHSFFDEICETCLKDFGDFIPGNYRKYLFLTKNNTVINIRNNKISKESDKIFTEDLNNIEQLEYLMTYEMDDKVSEYVLEIIPEDRRDEFEDFYYNMSEYFWSKYRLDDDEDFLERAIKCFELSGDTDTYQTEDFRVDLVIQTKNKQIEELENDIEKLKERIKELEDRF